MRTATSTAGVPKWMLFLWGPAMMSLIAALFSALRWLSPKKFEVDSFRTTYLYIMILIVGMLGYINSMVVISALGAPFDMSRAVEGCICGLILLLGNVLGKVRRNFFVGIRTPWSLADERVWYATHRLGAKTFFIAGLAGLLAVILRAPFWLPIGAAHLMRGVRFCGPSWCTGFLQATRTARGSVVKRIGIAGIGIPGSGSFPFCHVRALADARSAVRAPRNPLFPIVDHKSCRVKKRWLGFWGLLSND